MDLARLAHERPALTFVTVAGVASAATLLAMREMGCSRPTGSVGSFVWTHPVLTALGVIAVAAGAEKLARDGHFDSFMTGVLRRPSGRQPLQRSQQAPAGRLPGGGGGQQPQQPAGGRQAPAQRQQPPGSPLPSVQPAPYASASAQPHQDPGQQNLPSVQPAQGASAQAQPHQDPPSWAADIAPHFSWPPR
jgi:hypothetical protein